MARSARVALTWVFVRGGDPSLGEVDSRGPGRCRRMARSAVWRGGPVCIGEWEYLTWTGASK